MRLACFCAGQARGMPYIARIKSREEIERDRTLKFRRIAESAFFRVITAVKLPVSGIQDCRVDPGLRRSRRLRLPQRRNNAGALLDNLVVIFLPSGRDSFQHFSEAGLTVPIFRRKIGSTHTRLQIRGEPKAHWPAA